MRETVFPLPRAFRRSSDILDGSKVVGKVCEFCCWPVEVEEMEWIFLFFLFFFFPESLLVATALLRSVEIEYGVVAGRCEGKRKPAGCVP